VTLVILAILLWAPVCWAQSTVTITGTVLDNNSGNPISGAQVIEQPFSPTIVNGALISPNPVSTYTNSSGAFSLTAVGGVYAALYVPSTGALVKVTLPSSGTATLAQLLANQPNVVATFPPLGSVPMGGQRLQNLGQAQTTGDALGWGQNALVNQLTVGHTTTANLPTCNSTTQYMLLWVTDASAACSYGTSPASGGTNICLVGCNGTSWLEH
jgi:hypothetical protein